MRLLRRPFRVASRVRDSLIRRVQDIEHCLNHDASLRRYVYARPPIEWLESIPPELRMVAALDPYPPRMRWEQWSVLTDFVRRGQAVAGAGNFRHRHSHRTQIVIARVRASNEHEPAQRRCVLERDARGDNRPS